MQIISLIFIPYISSLIFLLYFIPLELFPNTFNSWVSKRMCYEKSCHSFFVVAFYYRTYSIENFHIV